jgi:hypothetical protein
MKINPGKSKATGFTRVRVRTPLKYSFAGKLFPEMSRFKYLGNVHSHLIV